MLPEALKAPARLTGWRRSAAAPLLPRAKLSAQKSQAKDPRQTVEQLFATRNGLWTAGRLGQGLVQALTVLGLVCLAVGMGHSPFGGTTSFVTGLGAGAFLATTAALFRMGLQKLIWSRTQGFRQAYENLHLAGKDDAAVAAKFVCHKEFKKAVALQRVLGGQDTRLGWRLRAGTQGAQRRGTTLN